MDIVGIKKAYYLVLNEISKLEKIHDDPFMIEDIHESLGEAENITIDDIEDCVREFFKQNWIRGTMSDKMIDGQYFEIERLTMTGKAALEHLRKRVVPIDG